ncbi:LysM peptidoglycan-binding domain-containing protein [Micromonospora lupini]|uniref:LysM peptidoglycan-binding domain-containing protein n=1 Tax=Micromonospora lupini TaxID=285679 RepID=UPI0031E21882
MTALQGAASAARPPSAAPTAPSTPGGNPKYYVVGEAAGVQREYLYQIAVRTLGDGNRYGEIFALNRDRPQPDGGRLTDPLVLRPGWRLLLPADAKGPGVHVGPLPELTAAGPSPVPSSPAAAAAPSGAGGAAPWLLAAAALVVMTLLLAVSLRVLRRGRGGGQLALPAPRAWIALPGARRLSLTAAPHARGSLDPAAVLVNAETPQGEVPSPPGDTADPAQDAAGDGAQAVEAANRSPIDAAVAPPPLDLPRVATAAAPTATTGQRARVRPETAPTVPTPLAVVERPATRRPRPIEESGALGLTLTSAGRSLRVRLIGRGQGEEEPSAWLDRSESPTGMTLPVLLGVRDGWQLCVNLAAASDVLTICGPIDDCRAVARSIVEQVQVAGHEVNVVGDALGADLPPAYRRAAALTELSFPWAEQEPPRVGVVISGGLVGQELAAAKRLVASQHRVVPIVLGKVLRSPWSIMLDFEADDA